MSAAALPHASVLLEEVLALLRPSPGAWVLDGTAGAGGHSWALANAGANVVALDQDPAALALAAVRLAPFSGRIRLLQRNFAEARAALDDLELPAVEGALLDLGVSSMQLATADRGFSFQRDGPLDMRMAQGADGRAGAAALIAEADVATLTTVLRELGEEHFASPIARRIKAAARMATTFDLVRAVELAVPRAKWPKGIHVATRTFQAIRLWVNRELEALDRFLADLPGLLAAGGRAAILSFHSLEDRAVKLRFRELEGRCRCPPKLPICVCGAGGGFRILTARPLLASAGELSVNPRARSAKLRAIEKIRPAESGELAT